MSSNTPQPTVPTAEVVDPNRNAERAKKVGAIALGAVGAYAAYSAFSMLMMVGLMLFMFMTVLMILAIFTAPFSGGGSIPVFSAIGGPWILALVVFALLWAGVAAAMFLGAKKLWSMRKERTDPAARLF